MKRYIAMIFAMGVILAGVAATSVSAKEHTVEKGDNLWNIAKEYNTTVDALVDLNDLSSTVIQPNQVLNIYQVHEVEKGESLYTIAKDYDVTIDELREWNDLESNLLFVGQELSIEEFAEVDGNEEAAEVAAKPEPKEEKKQTENKQATEKKVEEDQSSEQVEEAKTPASNEGKTMTVTATAYTADCEGYSGVTYTGIDLRNDRNAKVIAVDPNVIPLGSKVYVEEYGEAIAGDIGGAIKGDRIDIHVPTKDEAYNFGVREVEITILD